MATHSTSMLDKAGTSSARQAACLSCRKSKMKCNRNEQSALCIRCQRNGTECIVPDFHVGRHKGVKNKRSGLEKALHHVEEALRKSQAREAGHEEAGPELQRLLRKTQALTRGIDLSSSSLSPSSEIFTQNSNVLPNSEYNAIASDLIPITPTQYSYSSTSTFPRDVYQSNLKRPSSHLFQSSETADLADAENPLQLLAQTSELMLAPSRIASISTPARDMNAPVSNFGNEDRFHRFFGLFRPKLDIGAELDPIELGLITLPESDALFEFFFQNLAHTRWGIDRSVHTTSMVRQRSAFLFTSICAASALFMPSAASISKRLSIHCKKLAHNVITNRYRSVEIVLAFMVNIPWMSPGDHWADDETSAYLSEALTIAMDLSLHKIVRFPSESQTHADDIPSADCINPRKALQLDGFDDVEPTSSWGRRLVRRRERTWLALFVLERGVCLARGRHYTMPMTPLLETCDKWHHSDIADTWDGSIVSVAVLRREFAGLVLKVKYSCNNHQRSGLSGSTVTQSVKADIERFFGQWHSTWPFQIGDQNRFKLPPYVEILASHTRLSLYSSVINHPTAPPETKHYFRSAGLASALNVMRAAVQGESQLKSMPNNTAIMISFAACFALELSTMVDENRANLAPSVRNLITESADVLERIGSTPAHRKGASALYAKQLRSITLKSSLPSRAVQDNREHVDLQLNARPFIQPSADQETLQSLQNETMQSAGEIGPSEPVMFSGMSNDEIVEAINNAGIELEMSWGEFQFGDGANLDWLDWPI